ncbi:MAG: flagellar biosynthetic protein FliR [Myxococcales bacterium]|nr:flagellar biosynthetic protein FliR [Myxococcales bacterium]
MNESAAFFAAIVAMLVPVALATVRLVPVTMMLPLFGGRALPTAARTPILAVLVVGASPSLLDLRAPAALGVGLVLAALRELFLGLLLAIVLSTPFFAAEHAGRILDQARGAGSSEVNTLDGSGRATPLSELFRWTFGAAFVAAGGLRAVVQALAASFARFPVDPSPSALPSMGAMLDRATRYSAEAIASGLTLASAGLLALVAAETAVAIASRVAAPWAQSNVAIPARALAVLVAIALALRTLAESGLALARRALEAAQG